MRERQEQAPPPPSGKRRMREDELGIYGHDDDDVNYWADDADDEAALTFSTEKPAVRVGDAFGDLTAGQVAVVTAVAYVADVITGSACSLL